jgi:hypothetical protein
MPYREEQLLLQRQGICSIVDSLSFLTIKYSIKLQIQAIINNIMYYIKLLSITHIEITEIHEKSDGSIWFSKGVRS